MGSIPTQEVYSRKTGRKVLVNRGSFDETLFSKTPLKPVEKPQETEKKEKAKETPKARSSTIRKKR